MTDNNLVDFTKKNNIPVDGKITLNSPECNPFMEAYLRDKRVLDTFRASDPLRYDSHKVLFDKKWGN